MLSIDEIEIQLEQALKERDEMFPLRNRANSDCVHALLQHYVQTINRLAADVPEPQLKEELTKRQFLKERGIFLCGYMKCGTTLLLELLDAHPELIVLPGDSFLMGRKMLGDRNDAYIHGNAMRDRWLARLVNPTGQAPFWLFGKRADHYIKFVKEFDAWNGLLNEPQRGHLLSTILAYFSANPVKSQAPQQWVEKTPGNEFEIDRILQYFPEARFIHIVRDPRENLASLKRLYATRKWKWNPYGVARRIGESCRKAVENQEALGTDRYHLLQYEKLTQDPRSFLQGIIEFLDISWDEILMKPTINAIPAQANTMYGDRKVTGGVRKATKDKWKSVLSESEQRAALFTLGEAEKIGYSWKISKIDYLKYLADRFRYKLLPKRVKLNE